MASIREHKNRRGELTSTATVRRKGTNQKSISKTFPARELADAWAEEIEKEIVERSMRTSTLLSRMLSRNTGWIPILRPG